MVKESFGGGGKTGYDWLIKAFEMAYERWPDAILIYNDYNSIRWDVDNYINLVQTLRDAGAPIDAYGNQSHELSDISLNELENVLKKQQDSLKMPMFSTELDIDIENDAQQKEQYKKVLPAFWEKSYCAGVTLWGYVLGATWVTNSGLYRDGVERPAMSWIKEYMASDKAKNAVGPFLNNKKEASIYIRPASMKVARGDVQPIKIHARLATKTIQKVDFYVGDELVQTMTEAPYIVNYTTSTPGWKTTKAVVTATDGSTYERYGRFQVLISTKKRTPYNEVVPQIPGTLNISEYDDGVSGVTYSNASRSSSSMKEGQWMDYTVDVAEDGMYSFDAEIASANANGRFHLTEYGLDSLSFLTEFVEVPKTGSASTFKTLHGNLLVPMTAGRHVISLMVEKGGFNFKKLAFNRHTDALGTCMVKGFSQEYGVGDYIELTGMFSARNSSVKEVRFYANNLLVGIAKQAPYTVNFVPGDMGTYSITAVMVNAEDQEKTSTPRELKVTSPTPTDIRTISTGVTNISDAPVYNLMGVPVSAGYRGIVIKNGKKMVVK